MNDIQQMIDKSLRELHLSPEAQASVLRRIGRRQAACVEKRWKLPTALTVALIVVLLIATLAYAAARSELLALLFQHAENAPQAEKLLTKAGQSETLSGCTLTVDEYLLDGSILYVRWTAHSGADEPLLLLPGRVKSTKTGILGKNEYDTISFVNGILLGDELEGTHLERSFTGTTRVKVSDQESIKGSFEVSIDALFMKPVAPIVKEADMVNATDSPTLMLKTDFKSFQGFTMLVERFAWDIGANSWDMAQLDGVEYRARLGQSGTADFANGLGWQENYRSLTTDDYRQMGFAELLVKVPVTFMVNPDTTNIVHTGIDSPVRFEFDAFSIEFTKIDITVTNVEIRYVVNGNEAADFAVASLNFEVRPDDQPLDYSMDTEKTFPGDWPEGSFKGAITGEPPGDTPSSITIVPYMFPGAYLNQYAMQIPVERLYREIPTPAADH